MNFSFVDFEVLIVAICVCSKCHLLLIGHVVFICLLREQCGLLDYYSGIVCEHDTIKKTVQFLLK